MLQSHLLMLARVTGRYCHIVLYLKSVPSSLPRENYAQVSLSLTHTPTLRMVTFMKLYCIFLEEKKKVQECIVTKSEGQNILLSFQQLLYVTLTLYSPVE